MENEENVEETKKGFKWYSVVIILLSLVVLGLSGYIVYDKIISKDDVEEKSHIEDVTIQKENEESNVEVSISKEEVEAFLDDLVPDKYVENLLISETDKEIFNNALRYLVLKEKYTKDGDQFVFLQTDIQDLAYKYYMRDNFDYITDDSNFVYNSSNQTFTSGLYFELFGMSFLTDKTKEITDFSYSDNVATLSYRITCTFDSKMVDPNYSEKIDNYNIKLVNENGVLRIHEISKQ